jgi:hypothetical protein
MAGIRSGTSRAVCIATLVALIAALALQAGVAGAAQRPPGVGKPPSGSTVNTAAAYDDPQCDPEGGPYGKMSFVALDGPVCVAEWAENKDNGGATSKGVTKAAVKAVAIVPNEQQVAMLPRGGVPTNYATNQPGTVEDALLDALTAFTHVFGPSYTYGREIELEIVVSTGDDEAAQRADAVTVKAMEPFVVIDASASSLPIFDTEIAAAKIPVFSLNATVDETLEQTPYRWGQTDPLSGTINGAEFIGKQLAGKKAEHAGDPEMQQETRTFGLVQNEVVDVDYFNETLAKYDVKIAPSATVTYAGTTSTLGDPVVAQEQAPVAVAKMKGAGVTSVILLADSAMTTAMTKQATEQDYSPEWIYAGSNLDLPLLARSYDQDQWAHAFGLSNVPPGAPTTATPPNVIQWYWGTGKGTFGVSYTNAINWLMLGIMYAGPNLTAKTLQQGFFSIPAQGGSASTDPGLATQTTRSGYGKVNGLPYPEYLRGAKDFTATWWDPDTDGPPMLGFPGGKGTLWYVNDAQRYYAGKWPTKAMPLFDESKAIYQFDALVTPEVPPCTGCPSETGQGEPAASSA